MTHRPGHHDGDRFSRKQQLTGNRPRNENNRQHQQYRQHQDWDQDYSLRSNHERPITGSYDEENSRNFGPSYGTSDYYSRNVDSERGLYTGDPNYMPHEYSAPRYFQSREQDPYLPRSEYFGSLQDYVPSQHYGPPQDYRFANQRNRLNEDWLSYGDQNQHRYASRYPEAANYYGEPGRLDYGLRNEYLTRSQGDYFSQPYSAEKGRYEMGYRGKGPKGYLRSDDRLAEDISERLMDDYYIDASDIEVQSKDGIVTLSGTVNSRQLKHRAEDIVERCNGVKDIDNRLKIKNPSPSEQRMGSVSQTAPGSQSNKKQ
ncbi:MAG: BON domain-containing protein [Arenimonas sp.]